MHAHTAPKLRDRLKSLVRKRAMLKERIQDELQRPAPCTIRVRTLKRLRVRIKDQVNMIARQVRNANVGPRGDAA